VRVTDENANPDFVPFSILSSPSLQTTTATPPRSPGHYLSPGEDESLGLKRRLDIQLTMDVNENTLPPGVSASGLSGSSAEGLGGGDWEVGDCLGTWWRPNYETYMVSCSIPPISFQIIVFPFLS
jgi:hypothetical protein